MFPKCDRPIRSESDRFQGSPINSIHTPNWKSAMRRGYLLQKAIAFRLTQSIPVRKRSQPRNLIEKGRSQCFRILPQRPTQATGRSSQQDATVKYLQLNFMGASAVTIARSGLENAITFQGSQAARLGMRVWQGWLTQSANHLRGSQAGQSITSKDNKSSQASLCQSK